MGSVSLSELFAQSERDEFVAKMNVVSVLEALPGVGKVRARRWMEENSIPDTRRVQGLGANQREALLQGTRRN